MTNGKVVLSDDAVTTDLIDLANSTSVLVDGEPVPAGTYTELRFVITGGYIEVENADGSTLDLRLLADLCGSSGRCGGDR